jgi:hypothetical protein
MARQKADLGPPEVRSRPPEEVPILLGEKGARLLDFPSEPPVAFLVGLPVWGPLPPGPCRNLR